MPVLELLQGQTARCAVTLHERIAQALGWTVADTQSFSFQSLRELVRPVSPKLAAELDHQIQSGSYIVGPRRRARGSR